MEDKKIIEEVTVEEQKELAKKEKLKKLLNKSKVVIKPLSIIGAVGIGVALKAIYDDKKYGGLKPRWYSGWDPDECERVEKKTTVFVEGPSLRELKRNPNATGHCVISFDEDDFGRAFPED